MKAVSIEVLLLLLLPALNEPLLLNDRKEEDPITRRNQKSDWWKPKNKKTVKIKVRKKKITIVIATIVSAFPIIDTK